MLETGTRGHHQAFSQKTIILYCIVWPCDWRTNKERETMQRTKQKLRGNRHFTNKNTVNQNTINIAKKKIKRTIGELEASFASTLGVDICELCCDTEKRSNQSNLFHSEVKTKLQKVTCKEKYSQLFLHTKIFKMLIWVRSRSASNLGYFTRGGGGGGDC